MGGKRAARRTLLMAFGAVAIASIVIPAFGNAAPESVRLHIESGVGTFTYGSTVQTITTARNGCQITSAETIIDLGAVGANDVQPGFASDSIGVKGSGSNANGTPCSQVDPAETLTLAPAAGGVLDGRSFEKIQLDLEMTGNAVVHLTLSGGGNTQLYQLQTGTSIDPAQTLEPDYDTVAPYTVESGPGDEVDACAAPNSSGPNSGANDNCLWTVEPGFDFDLIELTTSIGTVSLEGGSDHGGLPDYDTILFLANSAPVANDDTADTNQDVPEFDQDQTTITVDIPVLDNDTDVDGDQLSVASVTQPENGTAVIDEDGAVVAYTPDPGFVGVDRFSYVASDGQALSNTAWVEVTVFPVLCSTDTVSVSDGDVTGSFTRLSDPEECKRYTLTASELDEEVIFQPEGDGTVTYRGLIELGPDPAPADGIAAIGLEYDPDGPEGAGGYQPLLWCENPVFDAGNQITAADIPLGETWCLASAFTRGSGLEILTTYQVYGRDDPGFAKPG